MSREEHMANVLKPRPEIIQRISIHLTGENLVTGQHLAAREAGKCSLPGQPCFQLQLHNHGRREQIWTTSSQHEDKVFWRGDLLG